jgi:hypothetical protein
MQRVTIFSAFLSRLCGVKGRRGLNERLHKGTAGIGDRRERAARVRRVGVAPQLRLAGDGWSQHGTPAKRCAAKKSATFFCDRQRGQGVRGSRGGLAANAERPDPVRRALHLTDF